jgi:hypothetical protein
MDWVVNTTVISNFAATGCLDLLRAVLVSLYLLAVLFTLSSIRIAISAWLGILNQRRALATLSKCLVVS